MFWQAIKSIDGWEYVATFAVLGSMGALLAFLVLWIRGMVLDRQTIDVNQLLPGFDEMHDRGELSDEEYKQIKAKTRSQLPSGLKERPTPGTEGKPADRKLPASGPEESGGDPPLSGKGS